MISRLLLSFVVLESIVCKESMQQRFIKKNLLNVVRLMLVKQFDEEVKFTCFVVIVLEVGQVKLIDFMVSQLNAQLI